MNEDAEPYGASVRRRRHLAGLRIIDLAYIVELGEKAIRNIEKGVSSPRPANRSKIEAALRDAGRRH